MMASGNIPIDVVPLRVHVFRMESEELDPFVRGLDVAMKRGGWKPAPLALASGLGVTAIRDMFRRRTSPTVRSALAIAETLGMTLSEVLALAPQSQEREHLVAVAGRVGAGAGVALIDDHAKGDGLYHVARPPQVGRKPVVAVEVVGDSMAPMYQPGHVLFFERQTESGVPTEAVGSPCVIADPNGQAWVKLLKRGTEPGLWNLISLNQNAESIWNTEVLWAAKVILALPADVIVRVQQCS